MLNTKYNHEEVEQNKYSYWIEDTLKCYIE